MGVYCKGAWVMGKRPVDLGPLARVCANFVRARFNCTMLDSGIMLVRLERVILMVHAGNTNGVSLLLFSGA